MIATTVVLAACNQDKPSAGTETPVETRPNVIWIVLDSCRADHLGCYGYARETSPAIDRLAAQGVLFERAYSQAPATVWSVPSYMTGRYAPAMYQDPHQLTLWLLRRPMEDEVLAPRIFADNGYATAGFSASPWYSQRSRLGKGFDHFAFMPGSETDLPSAPFDELCDRFAEWLDDRPEQPFFAYFHVMDTHSPFLPPNTDGRWLTADIAPDREETLRSWPSDELKASGLKSEAERSYLVGLYDGGIRYSDDCLAGLVGNLRGRDLLKNTIVIIGADHGEALAQDGRTLGHPAEATFDDTLHVPLIMAGPGLPSGDRHRVPVENADILPTLVDLLKLETHAGFDGISLVGAIRKSSPGPVREYIYARSLLCLADAEMMGILIADDTKAVLAPPGVDTLRALGVPVTDADALFAMPDALGSRKRIQGPTQFDRAHEYWESKIRPLWRAHESQPLEIPPMFQRYPVLMFEAPWLAAEDRPDDDKWSKVQVGQGEEGKNDWVLASHPGETEAPDVQLEVQAAPGRFKVSVCVVLLEDASQTSVRLKAQGQEDEQVHVVRRESDSEATRAWVELGTCDIPDNTFRFTLGRGNKEDAAAIGLVRFEKEGAGATPTDPASNELELERLKALGYGQ